VYPVEAAETVRFVKRAQGLGFRLDEVRELLMLAGGGPADCDAAQELAWARVRVLEGKIDDLTRMRDSLLELVMTCGRPRGDRRCPLLGALHSERREP
jgi:DNA-binding transcriptional MerR regulator